MRSYSRKVREQKQKSESDSEVAMCLIDLTTLYKNQNKLIDAEKIYGLGLKLQKKALKIDRK